MSRRKKAPSKVDQLIDELLEDCHSPEERVPIFLCKPLLVQ